MTEDVTVDKQLVLYNKTSELINEKVKKTYIKLTPLVSETEQHLSWGEITERLPISELKQIYHYLNS